MLFAGFSTERCAAPLPVAARARDCHNRVQRCDQHCGLRATASPTPYALGALRALLLWNGHESKQCRGDGCLVIETRPESSYLKLSQRLWFWQMSGCVPSCLSFSAISQGRFEEKWQWAKVRIYIVVQSDALCTSVLLLIQFLPMCTWVLTSAVITQFHTLLLRAKLLCKYHQRQVSKSSL